MSGVVTLALAGDVMLGRGVEEAIASRGHAWPWGDILPLLWEADLVLVNLECALTERTVRGQNGGPKRFHFRAPPGAVETLRLGHVDFASLANNHACDFGIEGMLETRHVLDRSRIHHAGAGNNAAEAEQPALLCADHLHVAVLAFADHPPEWAARAGSPGMNYLPVSTDAINLERVERALAEARRHADLVVFSFHWGPNMNRRPSAAFRDFAHRVVGLGADLFWGHSAHLVQGVEIVDGRPILYDTGDFVDDYAVDEVLRNDLSALFLVKLRDRRIERLELAPVQICDRQVNLARGEARQRFMGEFTELCAELGTLVGEEAGARALAIPLGRAAPAGHHV
jgi:poly-gamma-glutamate synthesis protein (capsule biosynthesis protein)